MRSIQKSLLDFLAKILKKMFIKFFSIIKMIIGIMPNPIFKYLIGYSNSNFIFLVKKPSKSLKPYRYTTSFFKDFYLKNRVVAIGHDWQKRAVALGHDWQKSCRCHRARLAKIFCYNFI